MAGHHNHAEIRIENLRVPKENMLGGRGQGHLLGQARPRPARLAHCMRWIGQAEVALDMMVDRSDEALRPRVGARRQAGDQWMIADSAMELYQGKLMVLHAAYKIDRGDDFRSEVSMAKHFVANALNRIIDRAIQVHGASATRSTRRSRGWRSRRAGRASRDGADEVHQWRIAQRTIDAYKRDGSTRVATGNLPL
jgi:acyl-CoA dehydrogenase